MKAHIIFSENEAICGEVIDLDKPSYGSTSEADTCEGCLAVLKSCGVVHVQELERVFLADQLEGKLYCIYRKKSDDNKD